MSICGEIDEDLGFKCLTPLQAGTNDELVVINFEDWDDAVLVKNGANPNIIEDIQLPSGAKAFTYTGKNNSNAPKMELIKTQFNENYNHEINFKIFQIDAAAKNQLELLDKGRVVCIVNNKFKGTDGDSAFEIFGSDAGMITSQNIREGNNIELGGAFDIILKSDELSLEPFLPKTLFKTDFLTTKAIVDGLK